MNFKDANKLTFSTTKTTNSKTFEERKLLNDLQTRAYNVAKNLLQFAINSYPTVHPIDLEGFLIEEAMRYTNYYFKDISNKNNFEEYIGYWVLVRLEGYFYTKSSMDKITDLPSDVIDEEGNSTHFTETLLCPNTSSEQGQLRDISYKDFLNHLTTRQQAIVNLIKKGYPVLEISKKLSITRSSIYNEMKHISQQFNKLVV